MQYKIQNITQKFLESIKLPNPDNKQLNYLIVVPCYVENENGIYSFPIGIAMISSALKASGRNVFTLNLNYKHDYPGTLRKSIVENNIDVVLTGGMCIHYQLIAEIFDTAKAVNSSVITVIGGAIVSADPYATITAIENADYGIIGEGEITVNELAYALESGSIMGGGAIRQLYQKKWR
ncbi:MAG: hypothetical protein Ta2B_17290 [Termitinemataceae bacterium]|nr:MAG: hypothetical protein Ta2B_17290 [Termitinemataceae bacterium]